MIIKHSVAFVIYAPDRAAFLIVRRRSDDDSLANVWGLPAASLREGETPEVAVIRGAKDKLGVDVRIDRKISEGELDRGNYRLHMREYEVVIEKGIPIAPQQNTLATQYAESGWGSAEDLVDAARKGSLCSQLYLSSIGELW